MLYFIQLTEQQGAEEDRHVAVLYFKNFCTPQNPHDTIFKLERNEVEL